MRPIPVGIDAEPVLGDLVRGYATVLEKLPELTRRRVAAGQATREANDGDGLLAWHSEDVYWFKIMSVDSGVSIVSWGVGEWRFLEDIYDCLGADHLRHDISAEQAAT